MIPCLCVLAYSPFVYPKFNDLNTNSPKKDLLLHPPVIPDLLSCFMLYQRFLSKSIILPDYQSRH